MDPDLLDPDLIFAKTTSGEEAMLQRTRVVQRNTRMVLILVDGNATVADVSVHDANTLLITGKAFGSTNLTVLDRAGNTIYTSQLTVGGEDDNGLTIVRSGATYSYSCVDKCRATPMVGDAPGHFSDVMATVSGKQATARGGN